jgi:CelD/BcsL family acetyltransferase involved in cellulose biosynthesis
MTSKNSLLPGEMSAANVRSGNRSDRTPYENAGDTSQGQFAARVSALVTVRVVTTICDIEPLRDVWTSFDGHRDGDFHFFLEYVQASSNTLRPHVIVVYRDGQAIALLAGRLDLTRMDQRLGYLRIPSGPSRALMFMGFRGEQSKQNCTLIIRSLLETLENAEADYAQIPTTYGSEIYRAALELPGYLCRDHAPDLSQNHILRISGDFKQVYSQLSANLREQIRRKKKKIDADFEGRADFVCYSQPGDLETAVAHAEEIARKSYQRALAVGFRDSASMRRRLHFCAAKGWLRILIAYLGGRPAAFTIGTVCNKTYTSDFLGYDPQYRDYSVGTVLQSALIERCCNEGVEVIDFSAGDANYKRRFGNDRTTVARLYVFAPHRKGVYLNSVKTAAASANALGKYILAHAGFLPRFKKALRSRAGS